MTKKKTKTISSNNKSLGDRSDKLNPDDFDNILDFLSAEPSAEGDTESFDEDNEDPFAGAWWNDTNDSFEVADLGVATAVPATDNAEADRNQRILWEYSDWDGSGRRFEVCSLWHWSHGPIWPYGDDMFAAYDLFGKRMTFFRLDGTRATNKWFECDSSENSADDIVCELIHHHQRFACGRVFLKIKGEDDYRLFNETFNQISENVYVEVASYFQGDCAWAKKNDGKFVVVHTDGSESSIEKSYATIRCFNRHAAPVSVTPIQPRGGDEVHCNRAERGCWGLINSAGQEILAPQFSYVFECANGLFICVKDPREEPDDGRMVSSKAQFFLYNDQGKQVLPCAYEGLCTLCNRASEDGHFEDGVRFWAKKGGKWGVINERGQALYGFILPAKPALTHDIAWNNLTVVARRTGANGQRYRDLEDIVDIASGNSVLRDHVKRPHIDIAFNNQNIIICNLNDDWSSYRFVFINGIFAATDEFEGDNNNLSSMLTNAELHFLSQVNDVCIGYFDDKDLSDPIDDWEKKPLMLTECSDGWHLIQINVVSSEKISGQGSVERSES